MGKRRHKQEAEERRKAYVDAIQKNAETAKLTDSMIHRITLKNVATFSEEGTTFENLQRVNYIFGENGAGKTTLSRLLATHFTKVNNGECLRGTGKYKECEVEWTGKPVKVLVYNKDFRDRNLKENIPGVFTLGEGSVDAENKLAKVKRELDEQNRSLHSKQKWIDALTGEIKQLEANMRNTLWNEVFNHQCEYFGECLKGVVTGNKEFAKMMKEMVDNGTYLQALDRNNLQGRYRALYKVEKLAIVNELEWPEEEYESLRDVMEDEIWQRSVTAKDDSGTSACLNCEKRTFSMDFLKGLGKRFDDLYQKDVDRIRNLTHKYEALALQVKEQLGAQINVLQTPGCPAVRHKHVMGVRLEMLKELIDVNYHIMLHKLENPVMVAQFKDMKEQESLLRNIMEEANAEIKTYNQTVEHQEPEKERLKRDMMIYLALRSAETVKMAEQMIALKCEAINKLQTEADEIVATTEKLVGKIKELEKKVASTKPTVEHINNELKRYGFTGFSIQPSKKGNYYQIKREDGSWVRDTLSEGETTFITFLYYMQLVKGGETQTGVLEPKVLVIDDPMSSLDIKGRDLVCDNVRAVIEKVNGQSKKSEVTTGINQVFVLTHNVEFYKNVTYVNPRNNKRRGRHHWLLSKIDNESMVTPFGYESPVKTGYEDKWVELKELMRCGRGVQNVMRQIVEMYFKMYGGYDKQQLIDEYAAEDEGDRSVIISLTKWMDDGSHYAEEESCAEAPVVANVRYMKTFKNLFVKLGHGAHYNMMMRERQDMVLTK